MDLFRRCDQGVEQRQYLPLHLCCGLLAAEAAQDLLEQVRAAGIAVRSTPIVYDPNLYVLKHTKAPAVLVENGFHINR